MPLAVMWRGALSLVLMVLSGCALLAPQPDASRFFTLSPLPEARQRAAAPDTSATTYGLGPITLPGYLDRNEVATRLSPTEVTYSATERWADPLAAQITRVLVQNLSALLDTDRVLVHPWPGDAKVDYQIEIDMLRFEHTTAADNQLSARWRIRSIRKGGYVVVRESNLTRPGTTGTTTDAVAALSGTVGDLSEEIAAALRQLAERDGGARRKGR